MHDDPSLDRAYELKTPDDSVVFYRNWAESYDMSFVAQNGYVLHLEVARHFALMGGFGPVLDVGAGTGICGAALRAHGIDPVDGTDISPEMLEVARQKGIYRNLFAANILEAMEPVHGSYQGAVSSGTFTTGHVGPDGIDTVLGVLHPRAWMVVSVNAEHYAAAGFAAKMHALEPQITDMSLTEVAIYADGATGPHAKDRALLVAFRKA